MAESHGGDLEVEQDLDFQRRMWNVERIGCLVLLLIMGAALLGFFGGGPLSLATMRSNDGLFTAEYERFGRRGANSVITAEIKPSAIENGEATVWISSDYLDDIRIDQITPMPDSVEAQGEGVNHTFLAEATRQPVIVTIRLTSDTVGALLGRMGPGESNAVVVKQFFFP